MPVSKFMSRTCREEAITSTYFHPTRWSSGRLDGTRATWSLQSMAHFIVPAVAQTTAAIGLAITLSIRPPAVALPRLEPARAEPWPGLRGGLSGLGHGPDL